MEEQEQEELKLEDIETTDLVQMIMEQVATVKRTKANLNIVTQSAREIQIELVGRGLKMEFEELSSPLQGGEIRLAPEIPSPGLTEALPEPDEVLDVNAPEVVVASQDGRTASQIQKDSQPTPQEVAASAANFANDVDTGYQKAFEQGMRQAARRMNQSR